MSDEVSTDDEDERLRADRLFRKGRRLLLTASTPHERDEARRIINQARKIHKRVKFAERQGNQQ